MTPEIAYCIGLFEGEGSVFIPQRGSVRMTMCQTDREPLERLVTIWGGKIFGPYIHGGRNNKPIYQWQLGGWDVVESIYDEIWQWLSPRRQRQFEAALDHHRRSHIRIAPCGERSNCSTLTERDVSEIRESRDSHRAIARRYGVSHATVGHIKRRVTWRHVA